MKLLCAPHCDDETLFGAYIIMNEKPLVAIIKADPVRMAESIRAMQVLGANLVFVDNLSELSGLDVEKVYAPAIEGGHKLHDLVGQTALDIWGDKVVQYSTYRSPQDLLPKGNIKVEADEEMKQRKIEALECYTSQHIATPVHFRQENKDEWLV